MKREYLSALRPSNKSGSHVNCFRGTYSEDKPDDHEDCKYQVWKQLRKWGHDVIVEAIFNNGKRGDVVDITEGIVYEITFSETTEKLAEKVEAYPDMFEIRQVDAKKPFNEKMLL